HASAANQAVVPTIVVVEIEGKEFGLAAAVGQDAKRALLHLGLDAAAAERAALAAVGENEHGSAGFLRGRAARLDHRAVDAVLPALQGRRQFEKKFSHRNPSSFSARGTSSYRSWNNTQAVRRADRTFPAGGHRTF